MRVALHENDLPDGFDSGSSVAVDCETMGLRHGRDRLCLVQVSRGDGDAHLVRVGNPPATAPRLQGILADEQVLKIFHFGRFDIAALYRSYGVLARPVYCTRIASLFARTFTNRHSLKNLCGELLGVEIEKEEQSSDWGRRDLTAAQMQYAATDVVHLHRIRESLDAMLEREGRIDLAEAVSSFCRGAQGSTWKAGQTWISSLMELRRENCRFVDNGNRRHSGGAESHTR